MRKGKRHKKKLNNKSRNEVNSPDKGFGAGRCLFQKEVRRKSVSELEHPASETEYRMLKTYWRNMVLKDTV